MFDFKKQTGSYSIILEVRQISDQFKVTIEVKPSTILNDYTRKLYSHLESTTSWGSGVVGDTAVFSFGTVSPDDVVCAIKLLDEYYALGVYDTWIENARSRMKNRDGDSSSDTGTYQLNTTGNFRVV